MGTKKGQFLLVHCVQSEIIISILIQNDSKCHQNYPNQIMDVPLIYVDTEQFYSLIISPNLKLFYMARLLKRKSRNAFLFTQKKHK